MEKDVPIVVVKGVGKSYGTVEALSTVAVYAAAAGLL